MSDIHQDNTVLPRRWERMYWDGTNIIVDAFEDMEAAPTYLNLTRNFW